MNWPQFAQLGSLVLLVVGAVCVVPSLLVYYARRYGGDDLQINRVQYIKGYEKADESLPQKAAQRRAQAQAHITLGLKIASGETEL